MGPPYIPSGKLDWFGDIDGILGYHPGEFLRTIHAWEKAIHSDDVARVNAALERHLKKGEAYCEEYRIKCKDGTYRYWRDQGAALREEKGEPYRMIGACSDITERKRAEEALRVSEEHYRTLFGEALDGICLADAETGIIIDCNQALATLVCRERAELIGRPQTILHPPQNDKAAFSPTFKQHLTDKQGQIIETQVVTRTGDIREVEIKANFLNLQGRKLLQGLFHNITERKQAEEALRLAEENFHRSLDDSPLGVRIVTTEGETIYANRAILDIYGYDSIEELRTIPVKKRYTPESYAEFNIRKEKRQRGEYYPSEYEISIVRKNGEIRRLQIFRKEVLWNGGRQFQTIYQDITERKRAEEAIKESEKRYRQVIENATEIIYAIDAKGNFTYGNPAGLEVTGFSLEELQRFNYQDLVVPEHRERITSIYIEQFREKQATTYVEFPFFNKAGKMIWFGQNASLVIEDGTVVGFHIIARDITERKRVEETLRESEDRYRDLVEYSHDLLCTHDLEGKLLSVNPAVLRIGGYSKDELLGMNFGDFLAPEVRGQFGNYLTEIQAKGAASGVMLVQTKGGEKRLWEYHNTLRTEGVAAPIVRGMARDITERKQAEEALRQSEERFRQLYDNAPVGYFEYDTQGRITSVNRTELEMLGYTLDEMIGQRVWKFIVEEETTRQQILAKLAGTMPPARGLERNYKKKDGTVLPVSIEDRILRDPQGRITGIRCTIQDITDRKKAEEVIRISEEKYRTILENIEDSYFEVDIAGNFTFFNDSLCRLLGYSRDETMGMNNKQYMDKENAQKVYQTFNKVYTTGEPQISFDWEIIRKDCTKRFIESSVSLIRNSKSEQIGFRGVVRDVTDRKQAEIALKESEKKFKELFDNAPVGYHEFDIEGRITSVNRTELEMLGCTLEERIGQFVWSSITEVEKSRQTVLGKLAGVIPPSKNLERTYHRKDGTTFPVLIQDQLLRDPEGKIIGIRSTIQDISEPKRAEQEMTALQDQLRQSQKIEAIGRLSGGIAHDFNNILTIISGNAQLSLLDLREGDPLRANIEEIKGASERAADLTRQLLAFSRKQIMEMQVLDLNHVVQGLDKMLHRLLGEDIDLVTVLPEGIGKVKADPGQIEQVIVNLAVNARDAMIEGGKLTIETADVELDEEYAHKHIAVQPGRYVMFSVSDTGVGMTSEVKERVFEPFFTTKEQGKGTGLGLSTVYGIVKQSGGNIWIYSEPGQGTTFKIYLPQVDEPLTEEKEEVVKEIPRGNETILVVEDEETVRKLAIRLLKSQGYRVLEAPDGGKALLLCEKLKERIHLILTDVVMPGMSGRKLVERLKEIHPEMKVLYMSGYTDNAILHHGILEPGINFMQKPFTLENLARKVREVLDKT